MPRLPLLLLLVASGAAITINGAAAQSTTRKVEIEIDYGKPNDFVDRIQSLGAALSESDIVYLDLTIRPALERGKPNYRVSRQRGAARARPLKCGEEYSRFTSGPERFSFGFNPDYNHLLLEIGHVPAAQAPFNTVGCVYRAADEYPAFFIRGYFAVSVIGIPAAYDVQLRPVSPSVAPVANIAR